MIIWPAVIALSAVMFQAPSTAPAQNGSPQNPPAQAAAPAPPAASVAPTQPVITIKGLCPKGAPAPADKSSCTTVITRAEFDRLAEAVNPSQAPPRPEVLRNIAKAYAELLAYQVAAKQAGLDSTDQFAELVEWLRLRALADLYRRNLQEKYRNPSPEQIHAYYTAHLANYERIKTARILIPRSGPAGSDKAAFDAKAHDAATIARARAVQGEDPDLIEKDTYTALGLVSPPPTDIGSRARNQFLPDESEELFALNAGDVGRVETEANNYVIYKVTSKETLPEEQMKQQITNEIARTGLADGIRAVTDSIHTDLDEAYFGPEQPARPAPRPAGPQPNAVPPHP